MDYVVCQIGARQYLIKPGETIEVDKLAGEEKSYTCDKVLLSVGQGKVEIGAPYLKKTANFEILETIKKQKVRVSTYKSKANYRKVSGQRRQVTKIKMVEDVKKA